MANLLLLKLYVASAVKGERSLAKSKLVLSKPVVKSLAMQAPGLLANLITEWEREVLSPGRNRLLVSLEMVNQRLLCEVMPVISCNEWVNVQLFFSESVITNAFKNHRIEAWAESNFCRRSGGEILKYSEQWSRLHWLVDEVGARVCYNPLEDDTMIELLKETRKLI